MTTGIVRRSRRESTIEKIVLAFESLIASKGPVNLTLDAIATAAGISKGTIIHHFKTKVDLEKYVLRNSLALFSERIRQNRGEDTASGGWTRAYIRASLDEDLRNSHYDVAPLLVASSRNPDFQKVMLEQLHDWLPLIENDGLDIQVARAAIYAADGVWWAEATGASIFANEQDRYAYIDFLLATTRSTKTTTVSDDNLISE